MGKMSDDTRSVATNTNNSSVADKKKNKKNKPEKTTKYGQIWLSYYKQGDDMSQCIVKENDGKVNAKASIENHIRLLQHTIDHLQEIHDKLSDGMDFNITGDTHHISIEGDIKVIDSLIEDKLVHVDDFMDQESEDEDDEDDEDGEGSQASETSEKNEEGEEGSR